MNQKAQIAPFIVLIIVVLILAIAATVLVGEAGFQRIRLANTADSALISAASNLCLSLNKMRKIQASMLYSYISLQTQLVSAPYITSGGWLCGLPCWSTKPAAYLYAASASLFAIEQNRELFKQAEDIAEEAAKNLRAGVYDTAFGSALVDEPKPFLASEVIRDSTGKITGLDYEQYLARDSHFMQTYRGFKSSDSQWYNHNSLSYSFNKIKEKFQVQPGRIDIGPDTSYESYLAVEIQDAPDKIDVEAMRLPLIFFWQIKTKPCVCVPGFMPHPWAWIKDIDMDSDSFGVRLTKRLGFSRFPFFGRPIDLTQQSRVRIKGSLWRGYDFVMER